MITGFGRVVAISCSMRYRYALLLYFLIIYLGGGYSSLAGGNEFLISQDFSFSDQVNPSVALGLRGRMAVTWVDKRFVQPDIYCQLYDTGIVPIGENFPVNDDINGAWQFEPCLASDWYGNYYIVWKDYRNNAYPFDPDIYYQKLDSTGFVNVNVNITVELPDSSHQSPAVASAGWGKSVVTWTDLRYRHWDVFVQELDANGNLIGNNQRVNDDLGNEPQHEPDVALSSQGWYVLVWYDGRNGDDDIYLQKFDSAGNRVGDNLQVNDDDTSTRQKFPSVAVGGNGNIFVAWTDWRNGHYPDNCDIYGQVFNSDLARLGNNLRMSSDATGAAQRDAQVAADRMGNACVVWSDSSGGDWNISGQIIDYNGKLKDGNFFVNQSINGKQLLPDVAMSGYDLYFVWADDRNGNYDIYGRIIRYNEPAVFATPDRIDFAKDKSDPDPEAVLVNLQNAGYGELNYYLHTNEDWIVLSQYSGHTPDSVYVSVNTANLDYGNYQGVIWLIDGTYHDSSAYLPITLLITGPLLDPSPKSMAFRALMECGNPPFQRLTIHNSGTGSINWSLEKTTDWLAVDILSGQQEDIITVGCEVGALAVGNYEGLFIISDKDALNSPESVAVNLDLQANQAYLSPVPDSIYHCLTIGEIINDSIIIENLGGNITEWQVQSEASWINLIDSFGSDNDYIRLDISSAELIPGRYSDSLRLNDENAFNTPLNIPCVVDICREDTVYIPPLSLERSEQGQVQLYLNNKNDIDSGLMKFSYDGSLIDLDSIVLGSDEKLISRLVVGQDPLYDCFTILISGDSSGIPVEPGFHFIGDIFLMANDSLNSIAYFDIPILDSFYLVLSNGIQLSPYLNHEGIDIGNSTATDNENWDNLPKTYSLGQNYPNPFNGRTAIDFDLVRSANVQVEVYNILGQRVKVLISGHLEAGSYSTHWDGRNQDGLIMSSGIYFYKMASAEFNSVKKMLYLK